VSLGWLVVLLVFILLLDRLVVGLEMILNGALDLLVVHFALLHLRLLLFGVLAAFFAEVVVTLAALTTLGSWGLVATALLAVLCLLAASAAFVILATASVIISVVVVIALAIASISTVAPIIALGHITLLLVLLQHLSGNFVLGLNFLLLLNLSPLVILVGEKVLDQDLDSGRGTVFLIFFIEILELR